jgi:hypothetical protein
MTAKRDVRRGRAINTSRDVSDTPRRAGAAGTLFQPRVTLFSAGVTLHVTLSAATVETSSLIRKM